MTMLNKQLHDRIQGLGDSVYGLGESSDTDDLRIHGEVVHFLGERSDTDDPNNMKNYDIKHKTLQENFEATDM